MPKRPQRIVTEKRWAEYYPDTGNISLYESHWTRSQVLDFRKRYNIEYPLVRVTLSCPVPRKATRDDRRIRAD